LDESQDYVLSFSDDFDQISEGRRIFPVVVLRHTCSWESAGFKDSDGWKQSVWIHIPVAKRRTGYAGPSLDSEASKALSSWYRTTDHQNSMQSSCRHKVCRPENWH
jgi:hypothetical protein